MTVCYILTDEELNIIVDKEELKPEGTNMQTTTMAVFPTEESVSRVSRFSFQSIMRTTSVQSIEEFSKFVEFVKNIKVIIVGVRGLGDNSAV